MDFATLKEVAVAKVMGPSQAPRAADVSDAFVGAMVNEGYHKVERAALWKFSEADATLTVARGSHTATSPPEDLAVPLAARRTSDNKPLLYHDDRQEFYRGSSSRSGTVQEYGVWGGELRFYPAPSSEVEIELRYYQRWADLSADDDEPVFPETWHDLLGDYAASRLQLKLPAMDGRYLPESAARPFQESWMQGLASMVQSDLVLPSWDAVRNHALEQSMWAGAGTDW